ncbi:WD40 repeat [Dillenia turbinata]|uniref:WD40 repeat n=1 Tax=Dillenia turbinata TaxID=194707 RepID=A0AAN8W1D0_9MAGN
MKSKTQKKPSYGGKKPRKKSRSSLIDDSFFADKSKNKRRRFNEEEKGDNGDEIIDSDVESGEESLDDGSDQQEEKEEKEFEEAETAEEKRRRIAEAYIHKIRRMTEKEREEAGEESEEDEREGYRDSLVAKILQQEQLEDSGRVRRLIASKIIKPESGDEFRVLVKHRQSVTAVALLEDDSKGFSASKDGSIFHWDVESGQREKYVWPADDILRSQGLREPQKKAIKHSKQVLALDVSSDGRYLATGGLDRHVHLWDIRTREHIQVLVLAGTRTMTFYNYTKLFLTGQITFQAFTGHMGPVSCLSFRRGTSELFSGSYDRTIKIWNCEDRAYINTLFGHQSEVLSSDCLWKERLLTAGRDRTLNLFKVPEETRAVFRAPASSLECCCYISNDEFLSGSDDGSIELWSVMRKKPTYIVKNAHALLALSPKLVNGDAVRMANGHIENDEHVSENNCSSVYSWVSSVAVCRSSDLAASGAGNGSVRLWAIESESKSIRPLFDLPLNGFVNSLAFAKSGRFLVAGFGQEARLGRWGRVSEARNGVAIQSFKLS